MRELNWVRRQFEFTVWVEKMSVGNSCTLRSVEERRSSSGRSFISWLYLYTVPIVNLEHNNISEKERPIEIRSILQPGISNKNNSGMEPLCIPQCIHNYPHLAPQLRLYPLQCPLEAQPEVGILRCPTGTSLVNLITCMALIQE